MLRIFTLVSVMIVIGVTAIFAVTPHLEFNPQRATPTPIPDMTAYSEIGQIEASNSVNLLAWNPSNDLLAFAEVTNSIPQVEIWNVETTQIQDLINPEGLFQGNTISALEWSPDGLLLAIAYEGYSIDFIHVWNITTHDLIDIKGTGRVSSLSWAPDSHRLAIANGNDSQKGLSVWGIPDGQLLGNFEDAADSTTFVSWGPDSEKLATATWDGVIQIWDTLTYGLLEAMSVTEQDLPPMWILEWNTDGFQLVGASCRLINGDCHLWLWDMRSGNIESIFEEPISGFSYLKTLAWNPQNNFLLGNDAVHAMLWNTTTGDLVANIETGDSITSVEWNSDGSQFAIADAKGLVKFWSAENH